MFENLRYSVGRRGPSSGTGRRAGRVQYRLLRGQRGSGRCGRGRVGTDRCRRRRHFRLRLLGRG